MKKYAIAVTLDERFATVDGVRWHFWLVSNSYDDFANHEIETGPDRERRLIAKGQRHIVGIKTWGELIEENRARLQFFQEHLRHTADEGAIIEDNDVNSNGSEGRDETEIETEDA